MDDRFSRTHLDACLRVGRRNAHSNGEFFVRGICWLNFLTDRSHSTPLENALLRIAILIKFWAEVDSISPNLPQFPQHFLETRSTIYRPPNTLARALSKFVDRICIHRRYETEERGGRGEQRTKDGRVYDHVHGETTRVPFRARNTGSVFEFGVQWRKWVTVRGKTEGEK